MSAVTKAAELRNLSDGELTTKLTEAKEELFNLRFQAATGQLESHGRLRTVRREIARIYTILREQELGITEPVDAPAETSTDGEDDA
jgi:large subunit ribosomal protein L29